ncbi:MAG: helix-hairpin-helix domain-containing protein [Flavobacteriaceae bacterium]
MNKFKSHFKFNKHERSGIFFFLLIIVILQGVYFYIKTTPVNKLSEVTVGSKVQSRLDSLRRLTFKKDTIKMFPFNPNYITDYKGYILGMSTAELDRLFAYREKEKFVNSTQDFQRVTLVSDSLLKTISPYFKFPEWVQKNKKGITSSDSEDTSSKAKPIRVDLNLATADELKKIYGIGDKLSARIVKFRDRLGGFMVNDQLKDVYGLESDVIGRILEKFQVLSKPKIELININTASVSELTELIYFNYNMAEKIVAYRDRKEPLKSLNELADITGFTPQKIDRIGLYLLMTNDEF